MTIPTSPTLTLPTTGETVVQPLILDWQESVASTASPPPRAGATWADTTYTAATAPPTAGATWADASPPTAGAIWADDTFTAPPVAGATWSDS